MKPKTDKQGWEEEFDNKVKEMPKKLIELVEWNKIKDFIRLQREQVRRETVEETLRGYVANEQLIESRRNDCSKGTIMWSKFAAEILNKYWFNKALSSDGEKKGNV